MAVNLGPSGLTLGSTTINDWDDVGGGKVLQCFTVNKNDRVRALITDEQSPPNYNTGALFTSFNFTPVASDSTLILQSSTFHVMQESNVNDLIYCLAYYDTTVIGNCNPYTSFLSWSGAIDTTFVAFNHAFPSWGTSQKTIGIRFGVYTTGNYDEYIVCNFPGNSTYDFLADSYHDVGFTVWEISA